MVFYTKLSSHVQQYMKYDPLYMESPIQGEDALKTGEFLFYKIQLRLVWKTLLAFHYTFMLIHNNAPKYYRENHVNLLKIFANLDAAPYLRDMGWWMFP